jgi:hypothetical protein
MVMKTKGGAGKISIVRSDHAPSSTTSKSYKDQERKWATESALDTLSRAKEIQADPKLMSDVKKLADEKMSKLASIAKK